MHSLLVLLAITFFSETVHALVRRVNTSVTVTPHVLELNAAPLGYDYMRPPPKHYTKRFHPDAPVEPINASKREDDLDVDIEAQTQQDLLTLSGRVYMTNITLAGRPYTLVIDTGSSDTWIATTTFQCLEKETQRLTTQAKCKFGTLYDRTDSPTFEPIQGHGFSVNYTDGEFLVGQMGTEDLEIGKPGLHHLRMSHMRLDKWMWQVYVRC